MELTFVAESIAILDRTPTALDALLRGLPDAWIHAIDGPGTWNALDVLGHLVHGERADWVERLTIILEHGTARPFEPFDREAQFREPRPQSIEPLLDEFRALRAANIDRLHSLNLTAGQLELEGTHPALGRVTARQLLATWTAHDLAHLVQINRTLARRYRDDVGPWAAFLSVMK